MMNKEFFKNVYECAQGTFYGHLENACIKLLSPKAHSNVEVNVDGLTFKNGSLVMDPKYRFVEEAYQNIKEQPIFGHCIQHDQHGNVYYIVWALPYSRDDDS